MNTEPKAPPDRLALLGGIAGTGRRVLTGYLKRVVAREESFGIPENWALARTFAAVGWRWIRHPAPLVRAQIALGLDAGELALHHARRFLLGGKAPRSFLAAAEGEDRRFKDDLWSTLQTFALIKQAYLLWGRHLQACVDQTQGLPPHVARKASFYIRQIINTLSPANFPATNPQVLKAALESGGDSLLLGLRNLLLDLERNRGKLAPRMTDTAAFQLGENVATTPGKVVFQNRLMQLLQYAPMTATVHRTPLLIIPPWINKFYILDLKAKNSFIRWAVEQGHTVFVISWVNPDEQLRNKDFADYLREGPLAALCSIEAATGERKVNVVGYCLGGTLLGAALGYMAAGNDPRYPAERVRSATFFASLIDFSDVGDMAVFIDEKQIASIEKHMKKTGYLSGDQMASAFNSLRENDLVWSLVVHNYLLGQDPPAFDLLYWNCDSTRMPEAMHSFYLRNMYLHNRLREPGGISLGGVPIDLSRVKTPAYFASTREDHIAPWRGTYLGARLFSGPVRFVLGGSGHIAGIVNPPAANKYGYATHPETGGKGLPETADAWLAGSEAHPGSFWPDWGQWLAPHLGEEVPARQPGDGKLPVIEDAPGSYVKVRI